MYKFSANRSDEEINKNIIAIANIILTEQFDIVAMQEVFSEQSIKRILAFLGSNWSGRWASPNSRSAVAAEGYAFLWNNQRFELAKNSTSTGMRVFEPRIYNQYRVDRANGQQELLRNPYYGRFKAKNAFLEIRLINTHIVYSADKSDRRESSFADLGSIALRKKEFEVLTQGILAKEEDRRYGNNMPAYTFILGDYNLNLNRSWTSGPYVDEVIVIDDGNHVKLVRTVQDELTTLSGRSQTNPDEPIHDFANNFDHFTYDENALEGVHVTAGRVNTVEKYYNNDFEKHKKEISDHVPVSLNIDF